MWPKTIETRSARHADGSRQKPQGSASFRDRQPGAVERAYQASSYGPERAYSVLNASNEEQAFRAASDYSLVRTTPTSEMLPPKALETAQTCGFEKNQSSLQLKPADPVSSSAVNNAVDELLRKLDTIVQEEDRVRQAFGCVSYTPVISKKITDHGDEGLKVVELASLPVTLNSESIGVVTAASSESRLPDFESGGVMPPLLFSAPTHSPVTKVPSIIRITNFAEQPQKKPPRESATQASSVAESTINVEMENRIRRGRDRFKKYVARTALCDTESADPWGLVEALSCSILEGLFADVAEELGAGLDSVADSMVSAELGLQSVL